MDTNIFIQAYAKDPINNYVMEDFTLSAEQHNSVCGDMIVIYLKIENESIQEFSYA
jgi:NifU-like protein involved in Fe-S cluster formation